MSLRLARPRFVPFPVVIDGKARTLQVRVLTLADWGWLTSYAEKNLPGVDMEKNWYDIFDTKNAEALVDAFAHQVEGGLLLAAEMDEPDIQTAMRRMVEAGETQRMGIATVLLEACYQSLPSVKGKKKILKGLWILIGLLLAFCTGSGVVLLGWRPLGL